MSLFNTSLSTCKTVYSSILTPFLLAVSLGLTACKSTPSSHTQSKPNSLQGKSITVNVEQGYSSQFSGKQFNTYGRAVKTYKESGAVFNRVVPQLLSDYAGTYEERHQDNKIIITATHSSVNGQDIEPTDHTTTYTFTTPTTGHWQETLNEDVYLEGTFSIRDTSKETDERGDRFDTVYVDGHEREYFTHLSPEYTVNKPQPLIIALHGFNSDAQEMRDYTNLNHLADKYGAIVVYPESLVGQLAIQPHNASTQQNNIKHWDAYVGSDFNDVEFIKRLLEKVQQDYNVDAKKIYLTGFSNGASMGYRVACELSDQFAAAAFVSGRIPIALNDECQMNNAVPILHVHGDDDPIEPFQGLNGYSLPVAQGTAYFAEKYDCADSPYTWEMKNTQQDDFSAVTRTQYIACMDNAAIELYAVEGGGHTWPGASTHLDPDFFGFTNQDIKANDVIWQFFMQN